MLVLGVSWVDFWSFWGVLGTSWGLLGRLGGVFGGLGGVLGGHKSIFVIFDPTGSNRVQQGATRWGDLYDLEGQKAPKREPRWQPKWYPKRRNSKTKTKMKKEAFEDRLGAVLGSSWVDLGTHLGSKMCVFHYVFQ